MPLLPRTGLLVRRFIHEKGEEFHRWFCPPLIDWEVAISIYVCYVPSVSRYAEQNVLVALVYRDDIWAEEGVIKSRDEEERLLDQVKLVIDVTGCYILLYAGETRLTS